MKYAMRVLVAFLFLGLAGSSARAQCSEGLSIFQSWYNSVTVVTAAQISYDSALYGVNQAESLVASRQATLVSHLQQHAACSPSCSTLLSLQSALQSAMDYLVAKQQALALAAYTLDGAITIEQYHYQRLCEHYAQCPVCN